MTTIHGKHTTTHIENQTMVLADHEESDAWVKVENPAVNER